MFKIIVFAFCGGLLSLDLYGQTGEFKQALEKIEQNNKKLKTYQSLIESRQLEYKSGNNLPDPQADFYYLPMGTHNSGNYQEFQIAQTFEFPTVYTARSKWMDQQEERLQLEYDILRQKVLLSAKQFFHELIYLNKRNEVEQLRVQQAKKVYDQVQGLYKKEQIGLLDLNKAKIAWMQDQFVLEQLENERDNALLALKNLNGGEAISINLSTSPEKLELIHIDSIWQEKMANDPSIKVLKINEAVSFQKVKLEKNKVLPNLTAGFNYQGVVGENYSGVYGGISIPLWNNRNKVKAARVQLEHQQNHSDAMTTAFHAQFQEKYNRYKLLYSKFREYKTTLEGLNSEALLLKAYELGEISFMEYYLELQFYRQAYDKMLEIENNLNQLKAQLLKHQL